MGNEAASTEAEVNNQNSSQEGEGEGNSTPAFEIKLGGSPSQDKPRRGNPVVERVIGQRNKAREDVERYQRENEQLRQQVSELSKPQQQPANLAPKYDSYQSDEEYQEATVKWAQSVAQAATVDAQPKPADQFQQFLAHQKKEDAINRHYSKAESLAQKFPDYSVAERAANETLGDQLSQEIIRMSDKSPEIMLYFGRNPSEAQRFKHLASSDGTQAAIELGRLEAKLNIEPVTVDTPDPDEPLTGGNNSNISSYEAQLKKARDNNDIKGAIAIRRKAEAEGINLN